MDPMSDYVRQLHGCGIHLHCRPSRTRAGDGTPRQCLHAGKLERWHSHDHDGLLVCGCAE